MPLDHELDPLLALLKEQGKITNEQIADLLEEQHASGKTIRAVLLNMEILSEDALLGFMASYMGTKVINLPATDIPPDVVHAIPASVARMYTVVPVEKTTGSVVLATHELVTPQVSDELAFVLSRDISFVLAREDDLRTCVNQFYGDDSASVNELLSALEEDIEEDSSSLELKGDDDIKGLEAAAGSTPVIRFVNLVLYQAVQGRASDIHFEPFENEFRIRYRVDGTLYEMSPPPKRLALPVISRLKVMSNLNIAERRLPQDGRIQLTIAGRQVDFRVSALPTAHGESVVLRVLDRGTVSLDIENLGMPDDVYQAIMLDIVKPNGIIVVTGPTGSGKTTTLYSALRKINTVETKILTAEEPVEYEIDGIVQVPINEASGNTFQLVLRAFLRQDPDILMIGEIRDIETAHIGIRASLTGHLVFSTLHTNDSAGAITRLIDMEVEPYLISSTMEAVISQRLLRRICTKCKMPHMPEPESLARLGISAQDIGGRTFYHGKGCDQCHNMGYRGRQGLFEYLPITDPIRDMINERKPTLLLRNRAVELGMRTLREDGIRNVLDGYTTVEEVLKYT
ncbi:MAG: GspE/PulE family protein [Kiritimatiellia bacterium]